MFHHYFNYKLTDLCNISPCFFSLVRFIITSKHLIFIFTFITFIIFFVIFIRIIIHIWKTTIAFLSFVFLLKRIFNISFIPLFILEAYFAIKIPSDQKSRFLSGEVLLKIARSSSTLPEWPSNIYEFINKTLWNSLLTSTRDPLNKSNLSRFLESLKALCL